MINRFLSEFMFVLLDETTAGRAAYTILLPYFK